MLYIIRFCFKKILEERIKESKELLKNANI